MSETELFDSKRERRAQIYKQVPGADIEPGWWIVLHPPWWDAGAAQRWLGPYARKAEAVKAARANLGDPAS